jgi:hypothetical protein
MKGKTNNPNGRPVGVPNKVTKELRQIIDKVKQDFEQLEPKDRIRLFVDLLQYAIPKYQSIQATVENMNPLLPETIVINVLDTGYKIATSEDEIKNIDL